MKSFDYFRERRYAHWVCNERGRETECIKGLTDFMIFMVQDENEISFVKLHKMTYSSGEMLL